jgi:acyl-CoA dehydrogenase
MSFELNDDQRQIIQTASKIGEKYGPEYWYEKEENHEFPQEFLDAFAEAGFIGLGVPEQYGGVGAGLMDQVLAFEAMASNGGGLGPVAACLLGAIFGCSAVVKLGTEEQKEKYLPDLIKGNKLTCLGLTEPNAGSDTLNISTFARKEGEEYVISGQKIFISLFAEAQHMLLITRTTKKEDAPKRAFGITLFFVDLPNDAIQYTSIPKHAVNYFKTYELGIDALRVPASCMLGDENMGWYQVLEVLNPERIYGAVGAVGIGRLAIRKAVEYANQREVFGKMISSNQAIQHPFAAAYAKLECAWLMVLNAAQIYDRGGSIKEVGDATTMAKYAAVDAGVEAVHHAMLTLGGYGFTKEYHIERWWREMQLVRLAPVTQHLTLNYIGQHILGMPRSY